MFRPIWWFYEWIHWRLTFSNNDNLNGRDRYYIIKLEILHEIACRNTIWKIYISACLYVNKYDVSCLIYQVVCAHKPVLAIWLRSHLTTQLSRVGCCAQSVALLVSSTCQLAWHWPCHGHAAQYPLQNRHSLKYKEPRWHGRGPVQQNGRCRRERTSIQKIYTVRKKAVIGVVPFQKVIICAIYILTCRVRFVKKAEEKKEKKCFWKEKLSLHMWKVSIRL